MNPGLFLFPAHRGGLPPIAFGDGWRGGDSAPVHHAVMRGSGRMVGASRRRGLYADYPRHRLTGPHEIENFVGGSPVPLPTLTLGAESDSCHSVTGSPAIKSPVPLFSKNSPDTLSYIPTTPDEFFAGTKSRTKVLLSHILNE